VPVEGKVKDVPAAELDRVLASGYGIFSGAKVQWAVLRFAPPRARYVSLEEWHPKQKSRFEADGSYVLELPFSEAPELVMEILKYGADVEVLAPPTLRERVASALRDGAKRYA